MSVRFNRPTFIKEGSEVILDPPAFSDMVAWYRGDSLEGSGSNATWWNDKSGNGLHAIAVGVSGVPTIVPNAYNNRTAARFVENNVQWFQQTSVDISQPFTVVSVVKCTSTFQLPTVYDGISASASFAYVFEEGFYVEPGEAMVFADGSGLHGSATNWNDEWHYNQVDWNGNSTQFWIDGNLDGSGGTPGTSGLDGLLIGKARWDNLPNTAWDGDIAEVIIYNRLLSSGERAEVSAYISNYYG